MNAAAASDFTVLFTPAVSPTAPLREVRRFLQLAGAPDNEVETELAPWAAISDAEALQVVSDWCQEVLALRVDQPEALYQHLADPLVCWLGDVRARDFHELMGALALAHLARSGVYRAFCPPIAKETDFVAQVLESRGLTHQKENVSKLLSCAKMWWEIFEAGLPLPPKLSLLEPLVPRGEAVRLTYYRRLCAQAGDRVPSVQAIRDFAESMGWYAPSQRRSQDRSLVKLSAKGRRLLKKKTPNWEEELDEVLKDIDLLVHPKTRGRKAKRSEWPAQVGCPFTLSLRRDARILEIAFDKAHLPDDVRDDVWAVGEVEGWATRLDDGGWLVSLSDHWDEAWAQAKHVEEMLLRQCRRLAAPAPVLVVE